MNIKIEIEMDLLEWSCIINTLKCYEIYHVLVKFDDQVQKAIREKLS